MFPRIKPNIVQAVSIVIMMDTVFPRKCESYKFINIKISVFPEGILLEHGKDK
jgi:hypothetical protein